MDVTDADRPAHGSRELSELLRVLLAADLVVCGIGYLAGPEVWRSSGTLAVIRDLGIPIPVWGGVFTAGGVALAARQRTLGHGVAALAYGFWGLATLATAFTGQLVAWGNPWHLLALTGVHGIGLWRHAALKTGGSG